MGRSRLLAAVVLVSALVAGARPASAAVWYVSPVGSDANSGTTWAGAFLNPQKAVDVAVSGDEVWVAAGTYNNAYSGGGTATVLVMKDGVSIYGGFAGGETSRDQRDWVANLTTLDGENASLHVAMGASNAVFDGFTATRGAAVVGGYWDASGAGMLNHTLSNLVVSNCTFADNSTQGAGGGMLNRCDTITVERCKFLNNTGPSGAGMYTDAEIAIIDCVFSGNVAASDGGGILNDGVSTTVRNCTFSGNWAPRGGGICSRAEMDCSVALENCLFVGNEAQQRGACLANEYMMDCYSVLISVTNCSLVGNRAGSGGVISNELDIIEMSSLEPEFRVTNCILRGNSDPQLYESDPFGKLILNVSYTCIQGGHAGTGNIDADPAFLDSGYWSDNGTPGDTSDDFFVAGDYHFQGVSPCIDAGTLAGAPAYDIEGNPRDAVPDMGAYEYQFSVAPAAPSGLTATAVSTTQINLSWTDNSTDEEDFELQRSDGGPGTWFQLQTFDPNTTSHSDTGLSPGTTYYYRVCARNANGDSAWSNEANATTLGVGSITVTYPNGGEMFLAGSSAWVYWYVENITGNVEIVYTTDGGMNYTYLATVPAWQGSYEWTLPSVSSTQCRVKVWEPGGGGAWGESDDFAIVNTGIVVEPEVIEFRGMAGTLGGVLVETFTVRYVARAVEPDVFVAIDGSRLPGCCEIDLTGFVLGPGGEQSITVTLDAPGLPRETSIHEYIKAAIVADAAGLEVSSASVDASVNVDPSRIVTGCAAAVGPPGTGTPGAALPCALLLLAALALPGRVRPREDAGKSPTCRGRLGSSGASGAAS